MNVLPCKLTLVTDTQVYIYKDQYRYPWKKLKARATEACWLSCKLRAVAGGRIKRDAVLAVCIKVEQQ